MTEKQKTLLLRFARTTAATAVAGLVGFVASSDVLGTLSSTNALVATGVLVPILTTLEKAFRYGGDAGEGAPDDVA